MREQECVLPSPAKVNITLRIVSKRADGYHDLVSTFIRIDGVEEVSVRFRDICNGNGKDVVQTYNARIDGENLINSAISFLRKRNLPIPPLEVKVWKRIPPGSGSAGEAAMLRRSFVGRRTDGVAMLPLWKQAS